MCGLVGIAGDVGYNARELFKDMLDVAQLRGRDSTGVIRVKDGPAEKPLDYTWVKRVGAPAWLFDSREYDREIAGSSAALIGHTRSKTVGEVSIKTAHPFDFPEKQIVGVHNGTLRNYHKFEGYKPGMVDSEILYQNIANFGAQETFSEVDGAFACVWWDGEEQRLNFIRNKERPLWFTWSKDKRMMFWASEPWMFSAVSRKLDLWEGEEVETDGVKTRKRFIELPENTLWSFEVHPRAKTGETTMRLINPRVIDPFVKTPPKTGGGGASKPQGDLDWRQGPGGEWVRYVNGQAMEPAGPYGFGRRNRPGGGEVADPFLRARLALMQEDDAPWELLEDSSNPDETPAGLPIIPSSASSSSKRSPASTVSTTDSKNTPGSPNNILCLPKRTSSSSPSSSSGEPSGGSVTCLQPLKVSKLRLKGVDFRDLSGITYITNRANSQEWTASKFFENTNNGKCSFCRTCIDDIHHVAIILNEKTFICDECVKEPKELTA